MADNKVYTMADMKRHQRAEAVRGTNVVLRQIELASNLLEDGPISACPTSRRRDLLTEANILLWNARSKLREALEAED